MSDLETDSAAEKRTATEDVVPEPSEKRSGVAQIPYLKVFGPDIGVFEFNLLNRETTLIGRSPAADIRLPHARVEPDHAAIVLEEDEYILRDKGTDAGTVVNGARTEAHVLQHGDSVQIGLYLLQFRTHATLPGADAAAQQAKLLLRAPYSLLPSTMRMRYRCLKAAPERLFRTGDTLKVGHGGLLVPTDAPLVDTLCLEIQLAWPNGTVRRFLGENVGPITAKGTHWMCLKLHRVSRELHEKTVAEGEPGEWVTVLAT